jgi:hypothetical protein
MYTDIMVDIETTSTSPDRGGILQIAAVKFNLKENTVCPNFFNKSLSLPPHRFWSEATRDWWFDQKESTLVEIYKNMDDWKKVIQEFAEFCYPLGHLRFWSKPTHFDYMFLSSYFADAEIVNPFYYSQANDLNSFLRGKYFPNDVPKLDVPFVGDVHNALADTLYQLKVLLQHVHGDQNESTT